MISIEAMLPLVAQLEAPADVTFGVWRDPLRDAFVVVAKSVDGHRSERRLWVRSLTGSAPTDALVGVVRDLVADVNGCQEHDDCRASLPLGRAGSHGTPGPSLSAPA